MDVREVRRRLHDTGVYVHVFLLDREISEILGTEKAVLLSFALLVSLLSLLFSFHYSVFLFFILFVRVILLGLLVRVVRVAIDHRSTLSFAVPIEVSFVFASVIVCSFYLSYGGEMPNVIFAILLAFALNKLLENLSFLLAYGGGKG